MLDLGLWTPAGPTPVRVIGLDAVTVDRNLSFQQNVAGISIAVFVLRARTNRLADLQPLAPDLLARLFAAHGPPGEERPPAWQRLRELTRRATSRCSTS